MQYYPGQRGRARDRSVSVYRIEDSRALRVDVRHPRRHIDLAFQNRLAFLDDRLRRRGCQLRGSIRPNDLDPAIDGAIPARANRLACFIDRVEPRDHVCARFAPLDARDRELSSQLLGRPNRAMNHHVMRRVHAAHRLVARERGGSLEL